MRGEADRTLRDCRLGLWGSACRTARRPPSYFPIRISLSSSRTRSMQGIEKGFFSFEEELAPGAGLEPSHTSRRPLCLRLGMQAAPKTPGAAAPRRRQGSRRKERGEGRSDDG
ncbi:hypothetical protein BRADI_1g18705v3 [Brachypodium distachyon]|uniref:Uncharacterized protein n=1 Tax=Brachypodium distachyon TaxID=15368 RepID=A0A0Q3GV40_BRADI|nr:hypothetical protein BRADI_1g18705v3 [Brachypodium distachyon]